MANVLQVIGLNTVTPQLEAGQTSNLDTYSMVSPLTIDPSGTAGYSGTNALTVTGNVSANALYQGTTNQAATTSIQLTASSVTSWIITGSGGQTIILPDATTLPVGAMFTFNNNQSSGAITVNVFGSGSAPATVQSGGYATVTLLTKSVAAGTWDVHYGTPSNVTWSTNTFNYPGTITGATWNGVAVPVLYGGTGVTTSTGTGSTVLSTSPTLVTPILGTPTSGTLTNCTLPTSGLTGNISLTTQVSGTLAVANGGTGTTTATGTAGSVVLSNTPTLVTPVLGAATGTSLALGTAAGLTLSSTTTGLAPSIAASGTDTNIPIALQSKGTGGIDLTAGSGGVNISNGTTVTSLARTVAGTGYTTPPTWTASVPTGPSGTTASGSVTNIGVVTAVVSAGGSGYVVGDVLTVSGGTQTTAATLRVATVSTGAVATVTIVNVGAYTATPTNPVSVTGGTGTSATFTLSFGINNAFTITVPGTGYIETPTISFSGGGGSSAAAIAGVGSAATIKGLGGNASASLNFATAGGTAFQIQERGGLSDSPSLIFRPGSAGTVNPVLTFSVSPVIQCGDASSFTFRTSTGITGSIGGQQQFSIVHTASAVNYLNVTGAATTAAPALYALGTDANISLNIASKGTGAINLQTGATTATQASVIDVAGSTRYAELRGGVAGSTFPAIGTGGGTEKFSVFSNSNSLVLGTAGYNSGIVLTLNYVASQVNAFTIIPAIAGSTPSINATGTDTNISLNLVTKGTGTLQINGTAWQKTKTTLFSYTGSAQTYTMATGCVSVAIMAVGGGGGGGFGGTYSTTGSGGAAGGGGGTFYGVFRASDISASSPFTVTVGQGGAGGTSGSTTGTQGGITSVGSIAYGGGAGGGGPGSSGATSGGGAGAIPANIQSNSGTTSGGTTSFAPNGGSGVGGNYTITPWWGGSGGGCSAVGVAGAGGGNGNGTSGGGAGGGLSSTVGQVSGGGGGSIVNFSATFPASAAAGANGTAGTANTVVTQPIFQSTGGSGGGGGVNGGTGGAGGLGSGGGGGGAGTTAGGNGGAGGNGLVLIVEYF